MWFDTAAALGRMKEQAPARKAPAAPSAPEPKAEAGKPFQPLCWKCGGHAAYGFQQPGPRCARADNGNYGRARSIEARETPYGQSVST